MSRLRPDKLHTRLAAGAAEARWVPRRYTLTHSDSTGDLFLTIGPEFDRAQVGGWTTRLLRDEVLAEWLEEDGPALHVYCHVSGGLVVGPARWRYEIFQRELPLVLEAFRHGDAPLYRAHPELEQARIRVHFASSDSRYRRVEDWGTPADYRAADHPAGSDAGGGP